MFSVKSFISSLLADLRTWRPGSLAKGTLAMSAGMGLRIVGQAAVFLLVARVLGVRAYGAYAAVLAIASTLGNFGGLGAQMLMQRDVARGRIPFPRVWGRSLAMVVLTLPVLFGLYLLVTWAALPATIPWSVALFIGLAEMLFAPIVSASICAYQGHDRIGRAARLVLISVVPRFAGALLLFALAGPWSATSRLVVWSVIYVLAALCSAAYAISIVYCDFGRPAKPDARGLRAYARAGVPFAFGGAAMKFYADIDKTLLARLATLEVAGIYSAGYRVVEMATVPLNAMLAATMPKVFRAGESGLVGAFRYGRQIFPLLLIYTFVAGWLLFGAAPLLPILLGKSFQPAVTALRWLAWLPLVSLPRLVLQTLLFGADRQRATMAVLSVGALLNVVLNIGFIPELGWRGAVLATYLAEVTMTLGFLWFVKKSRCRAEVQSC